MFGPDLDDLDTTALLAAASNYAHEQEHAAVGILRTTLAFADRNAVVEWPGRDPLPGYERLRVYGGEGCPGVAEFAPIELGAVLAMSSGAASSLIGEALALRHRLPRTWAAVLNGAALSWKARSIARACLSLSLEAAAIVDRRVAGIVNTITPGALKKIVTAALWQADPDKAHADAEATAKQRGVFVTQSDPADDHGTKRIWVRAATGDVIRFDATINDLARALKILGDTDTLDQRRAKAIGWIADPEAAHNLLEVARLLARRHQHQHRSQPTQPAPTPTGDDQARYEDETRYEDEAGYEDEAAAYDDVVRGDATARAADSADGIPGVGDLSGAPDGEAFTRLALAGTLRARLAAVKEDASSNGLGAGRGRRARHTLYVHLTDKTLATGTGVLRVEELGPLLASQLSELLGHDRVVVKPVIDLHDQVSVHSYEIPDRIRERVRLRHPVDMFPFSGAEATVSMDQDHITPYDHTRPDATNNPLDTDTSDRTDGTDRVDRADPPNRVGSPGQPGRTRPPGRGGPPDRSGPPGKTGQTGIHNLIPQGRLHHRAKTFGGWRNRRLPSGAIEWTSPHGFRFHVDHNGTRPLLHRQTNGRKPPPPHGS